MEAAELLARQDRLSVRVISARFAKPLDEALICKFLAAGKPVVLCEDHSTIGGFGSAVLEHAASRGLDASKVRLLGLPDRFIAHAKRQINSPAAGLDPPRCCDDPRYGPVSGRSGQSTASAQLTLAGFPCK
jgi:1-deoxy-D-xylulose-5-phosphate synthase